MAQLLWYTALATYTVVALLVLGTMAVAYYLVYGAAASLVSLRNKVRGYEYVNLRNTGND